METLSVVGIAFANLLLGTEDRSPEAAMFFQNADPGCGPKRRKFKSGMQIPETRPSILDPLLETEPWIDKCPCADTLVLFLHNHPIAVIPGSKMESVSLAMRLSEMRHRAPRHATS